MLIKCALFFGASLAGVSAFATLWFLCQILLWTFALAANPLDALVRMAIWAGVFVLSLGLFLWSSARLSLPEQTEEMFL